VALTSSGGRLPLKSRWRTSWWTPAKWAAEPYSTLGLTHSCSVAPRKDQSRPDAMSNGCFGSGVPLRPVRNRPFTKGLMPSTVEYPVLMVKRSLVWSIAERRLTILATARTDVPE
jgi:hypothetical protein